MLSTAFKRTASHTQTLNLVLFQGMSVYFFKPQREKAQGADFHILQVTYMRRKLNLTTFLYLTGAVILLVGLGAAIWIYLTAEKSIGDPDYEIAGGYVYSSTPGNTKKYTHDLELYGGKAAVLAEQFSRWFRGLWAGQTLAFTVFCISLLLSCGFFLAARSVSRLPSDAGNTSNSDKIDKQG